jgi:hypothetical protein
MVLAKVQKFTPPIIFGTPSNSPLYGANLEIQATPGH